MIPKEMCDLPQWVGVKNNSKIPLTYTNGRLSSASSSNPDTWTTFDGIAHGIEKGLFDNYGFVFRDNGIIGIDIDAGFNADGYLSPLAIDIMKACHSYTEYSRSGRGMHIYVKGVLPFGGRNNRHGVEIYQSGRYFIVTGKKLIFENLIENQAAVDYVVEKYFPDMIIKTDSGKQRTKNIYQPVVTVTVGEKLVIETEYPDILQGSRNISLTSLAGQLHSQGYSKEGILQELITVNKTKCKPPLDIREIKTIVNSVARYARG